MKMRETLLLKTHFKNFYKMEKDKYLLFEPGESRGNRKRETKGTKRDELFHSLGRLFKTEMYVRLNNYHNSCIPYLDNRSLYNILFFFLPQNRRNWRKLWVCSLQVLCKVRSTQATSSVCRATCKSSRSLFLKWIFSASCHHYLFTTKFNYSTWIN